MSEVVSKPSKIERLKKLKNSKLPSKVDDKSRKWMSYQLNIFRISLLVLGYKVAQAEQMDLSDGLPFSWDRLGYIILMFASVILLYRIEQWERREVTTVELEKLDKIATLDMDKSDKETIQELKAKTFTYIMDTLLPEAETSNDKLNIIDRIPNILSQTSTEDMKRTITESFQAIIESFDVIFNDMFGDTKKTQVELRSMMDKIMKKPLEKKEITEDDLLPQELKDNEEKAEGTILTE